MKKYVNKKLLIQVSLDAKNMEMKLYDIDSTTQEPIESTEGILRELNVKLAKEISEFYGVSIIDYGISIIDDSVEFEE